MRGDRGSDVTRNELAARTERLGVPHRHQPGRRHRRWRRHPRRRRQRRSTARRHSEPAALHLGLICVRSDSGKLKPGFQDIGERFRRRTSADRGTRNRGGSGGTFAAAASRRAADGHRGRRRSGERIVVALAVSFGGRTADSPSTPPPGPVAGPAPPAAQMTRLLSQRRPNLLRLRLQRPGLRRR